jgi:hypothetical protein
MNDIPDLHMLGKLCGWDVRLHDIVKRLRCSKYGKKKCVAGVAATRRRAYVPQISGYTALR